MAGGFINYISDVLPQTRRISPVLCSNCQSPRDWLNYLLLRPCGSCRQRRSIRAWVVQLAACVVFAVLWLYPPNRLGFWVSAPLLVYFGIVTVIDFEHRLIMNPVSLAGIFLAGVIGLWLHGWQQTLIGGLAGFLIMLSLYYLGYLFAKGLGKLRGQAIDEEALGFGDVNLSGVLGLLLGWPGITAGLIFAILLGGAGSLIVLLYTILARRYQAFQAIPYGPFLVLAAVIVLFTR
jgi:leader peptidase (prepilin peptidase)/N-methyltransferase